MHTWLYHSVLEAPENVSSMDIGETFARPDVQSLLQSITGFNHKKLFRFKALKRVKQPDFKMFADKQLLKVSF